MLLITISNKDCMPKNNNENPIALKVHNLILLSQKANLVVPNEIREKIQVINTFNISARYKDLEKRVKE